MSSGFVPQRRSPTSSTRSSRSYRAYTSSNPESPLETWLNRLEGYSPSTMQEISGGTEGQRQLRETTPSYQATQFTAQQAGIEEPQRSEGALESIARWLGRGSSAMTGAISGALGKTRYTEEGADIVAPGERFSAALRRMGEGWDMQDYYSWSDFGTIAKKKSEGEELEGWETAYNFGKGLALDIISDPLTYVSFGGSIFGRVGAAPIIRNKAGNVLLKRVAEPSFDGATFIRNVVSDRISPISARGVANRQMEIFRAAATTGNDKVDDLFRSTRFDPGKNIDNLIADIDSQTDIINRAILEESLDMAPFDPYKVFAVQKIPDIAGSIYMVRGIGGAKRWINKTLGADYGKAFWDALPNDIKGGLRIRVPFYRSSDGNAIAMRVPGIGGGELTERLGKMGINIDPIVQVSERGRDMFRQIALSIPGFNNLLYKGKGGGILGDAILGATGKRRIVRKSKKTSEALTDLLDYGDFNAAIWKSQGQALSFAQEISELHYIAAQTMNKAFDLDDTTQRAQVVEMFWDILGGQGPKEITNDLEDRAFQAAAAARTFFDRFADEAISVTKDGRVAFNRLNYYAPRRFSSTQVIGNYWDTPGYKGIQGAKTQNLKPRRKDVSLWGLSKEGEAYALRFEGPHRIYRGLDGGDYDKIYIDDPLSVMADYAESFTRTLDDLRLAQTMASAGLFTKAQSRKIIEYDESFIEEKLVEVFGTGQGSGRARELQRDIMNRLDDEAIEESVRKRGVAELISQRAPGMGVITRENINKYYPVTDGVWKNQLDGTEIRYEQGGYAAYDIDGTRMLDPVDGSEIIYADRLAVQEKMAEVMATQRIAYWNNRVSRDIQKTLDELDNMLENYPDGYHRLWAQVEEDARTGVISAEEMQKRKNALSDRAVEWLNKFNLDEVAEFDPDSGVVNWKRGKYQTYVVKDEIKRIVENQGLYDVSMVGGGGRVQPRRKVEIQARVVEHLGDVYAPKAMMDTFVRMFQVVSPGGLEDFLRTTYYPYYAMVRSWLTVGRGPGFVNRNVMGGMWNNYISGVARQHHLASARVLFAKKSARNEAEKLLGEDASITAIESKTREIFRKTIAEKYTGTGTFIDGVDDADALMEIFVLSNKTGLTGGRSGRIANEAITYGNYTSSGAFSALTPARRRELLDSYAYRRLPDVNEPIGRTPTKREEILYKIGFDNPWIRDIMSPLAGASEDYLRLAAFIKGVQEMGLESVDSGLRGFAAATWVKGTQFDYQDLSYVEQAYLKNIMTFYTWARNNVPLQVRAFVHNPGHIANALRIHRNLAMLFQDDSNELSPSYVNNQMMFEIDKSKFDILPDIIEPDYDIAFGIPWADPIIDVNRWFQIPGYRANSLSPIRRDELPQNLNPLLTAAWSLWEATTRGADFDERDLGELANWTRIVPGATALDYGEAQVGIEDGEPPERKSRRAMREFLTNILPQLGLAERIIPGFGDARQQNRLLTSWVSSVAGLPFVTVDDYQVAGQMRRDREGYRQALEEMFGETAEYRIAMNKALMDRGASLDFLYALDAAGVPRNEVDVRRAIHAWELYRMYRAAIDRGTDEREILALMYSYSGESEEPKNLVSAIWDALPALAEGNVRYTDVEGRRQTITTDESELYRMFAFAPATEEEKQWLGYSDEEIDDMSPAEQFNNVIVPLFRKRNEESGP